MISYQILKKYAKIASEAFVNDPVYRYVAKNERLRKYVIYHGTLIRLYASRNGAAFYEDEQGRGLLVLRSTDIDYSISDYMKAPNRIAMVLLLPYALKLFGILGQIGNNVLGENVHIISPIFVSPEHHNKGVASTLVKKAVADMAKKGCKVGLDTQNRENVFKYEKMGFTLVKEEFFDKEKIHNYYMIHK